MGDEWITVKVPRELKEKLESLNSLCLALLVDGEIIDENRHEYIKNLSNTCVDFIISSEEIVNCLATTGLG